MDPIRDSLDNPMVLVIRESRAQSWPQAKLILDTIEEHAPFVEGLKSFYFVVKQDRELYAKAMALIELLSHTKALQIFVNGAVKRNGWELRQIGECFLKATKMPDHRRYCHVIHEHRERRYGGGVGIAIRVDLFGSADSEEEQDKSQVIRRTAVPCRMLYDRIGYKIDDEEIDADGFLVRAINAGVDLCPLFDASGYAEVFPKIIGKDGRVENGQELD